jgi:hypothetical protein
VAAGATECIGDSFADDDETCDSGLLAIGVISFVVFRIWDIVDVWATPLDQERRYRYLKKQNVSYNWRPIILAKDDSALVGLQFRF